jgi:hypothetical protein
MWHEFGVIRLLRNPALSNDTKTIRISFVFPRNPQKHKQVSKHQTTIATTFCYNQSWESPHRVVIREKGCGSHTLFVLRDQKS